MYKEIKKRTNEKSSNVPLRHNTTVKAPDKLYFAVPKK